LDQAFFELINYEIKMKLPYLGKTNGYSTMDCFWRLENGLKKDFKSKPCLRGAMFKRQHAYNK
jgi:hypothetical protein